MKDNTAIKALIIKALSEEELSFDEQILLDKWLAENGNREVFDNLRDKDYLRERLKEAYDVDIEEEKKALNLKIANRTKIVEIKNRTSWVRYAAAILIMAGATTFFLLILKKNGVRNAPQQNVATINNDAAPGSFNAKLKLSDNSEIILDSAMTGTLTSQGNALVMNKDGNLVYTGQGKNETETLYNTLVTSAGQMYPIILSDNSRIWLNSSSSLKFPVVFSGKERRVEVTGEAYFEIAHDASRPFIVAVNGAQVRVLGTKFNINSYSEEGPIQATLLEGAVQIKKGIQQTTIKPGEQAKVFDKEIKVVGANLEKTIAWKEGRFYFEDDDIKTIMGQISKWYGLDIEYKAVPDQLFNAIINRKVNASIVLKALEATGDVHFNIEGKKIIVTK